MLARAIREGVGHDGRPLNPAMWYLSFRRLSDEDLASVVVYLRSVPAVRNLVPRADPGWRERLEFAHIPEPITEPVPVPDLSDPVKRGEYLEFLADCAGCHTSWYFPESAVHEKYFGGGNLIQEQGRSIMSPNVTLDPSGISYYDEAMFLTVMRTGKVGARVLDPIMPWYFYRQMSDEDLKALFAFLRAQEPVQHIVDNTEPPTYCRRCLQSHGSGDRN